MRGLREAIESGTVAEFVRLFHERRVQLGAQKPASV